MIGFLLLAGDIVDNHVIRKKDMNYDEEGSLLPQIEANNEIIEASPIHEKITEELVEHIPEQLNENDSLVQSGYDAGVDHPVVIIDDEVANDVQDQNVENEVLVAKEVEEEVPIQVEFSLPAEDLIENIANTAEDTLSNVQNTEEETFKEEPEIPEQVIHVADGEDDEMSVDEQEEEVGNEDEGELVVEDISQESSEEIDSLDNEESKSTIIESHEHIKPESGNIDIEAVETSAEQVVEDLVEENEEPVIEMIEQVQEKDPILEDQPVANKEFISEEEPIAEEKLTIEEKVTLDGEQTIVADESKEEASQMDAEGDGGLSLLLSEGMVALEDVPSQQRDAREVSSPIIHDISSSDLESNKPIDGGNDLESISPSEETEDANAEPLPDNTAKMTLEVEMSEVEEEDSPDEDLPQDPESNLLELNDVKIDEPEPHDDSGETEAETDLEIDSSPSVNVDEIPESEDDLTEEDEGVFEDKEEDTGLSAGENGEEILDTIPEEDEGVFEEEEEEEETLVEDTVAGQTNLSEESHDENHGEELTDLLPDPAPKPMESSVSDTIFPIPNNKASSDRGEFTNIFIIFRNTYNRTHHST